MTLVGCNESNNLHLILRRAILLKVALEGRGFKPIFLVKNFLTLASQNTVFGKVINKRHLFLEMPSLALLF